MDQERIIREWRIGHRTTNFCQYLGKRYQKLTITQSIIRAILDNFRNQYHYKKLVVSCIIMGCLKLPKSLMYYSFFKNIPAACVLPHDRLGHNLINKPNPIGLKNH